MTPAEQDVAEPSSDVPAAGVRPFDWIERTLLAAILLFSLGIRLPGITSGDLWADDAWMALPAKLGVHDAARISVTTPLFTQISRLWIMVDPGSSPWAQALPLGTSIAAVGAIWWLMRRLGTTLGVRVVVTMMSATAPAAVTYGTHVKEYSTDLLLCALLLVGLSLIIEQLTWKRTGLFVAALSLGCVTSGAVLIAAAGAIGGLGVAGLRHRWWRRAEWLVGIAGSTAVVGLSWLALYSHPPTGLVEFWSPWELGGQATTSAVRRTLGLMGSGVAHGLFGVPEPVGRFPLQLALSHGQVTTMLWTSLVVALVVVLGLAVVVATVARGYEPRAAVGSASAVMVLVAFGISVAGKGPFGAGRTDLVWYPAAWVIVALLLECAWQVISGRGRRLVILGTTLTTIAVVGLGWLGVHFRAWYPHQDLRRLVAAIAPMRQRGDLVIVGSQNTWGWALYDLGPTDLDFTSGSVDPAKGWGVAAGDPSPQINTVLEGSPAKLCELGNRLWWFGIQSSAVSPSAYRLSGAIGRVDAPPPVVITKLVTSGWALIETTQGSGVYAQLWVHRGICAS